MIPKMMHINKRLTNAYGYTASCQGCLAMEAGRPSRAHSEARRKRFRKATLEGQGDKLIVEEEDRRAAQFAEAEYLKENPERGYWTKH